MSKYSFVKYQGAGNDFLLIDNRALAFNSAQVPALCHRKFGIGADGVLLLEPDADADFRMRIFNCDGSEAESCGNGLRCLMRFLLHLGLPRQAYRIATGARIVEADFLGDRVRVLMADSCPVQTLSLEGREVYFADTGVPHVVVFVPAREKIDVAREGALWRHHPFFQPRGTNVNFATWLADGSVAVRTFERGVEGETLACGTGGTAVGVVAVHTFQRPSPVHVRFAGGDLEIHVGEKVYMVGDAVKVFEGVFEEDSSDKVACKKSFP